MSNALHWLSIIAVAATVLVVAILPAEYGIDPTGAGQVLGLTALAASDEPAFGALSDHLDNPNLTNAVAPPMRRETLRFELGPFESVEYKYQLRQGDSLLYRWHSSGQVLVNFHSEPDQPTAAAQASGENAVSFNQGRSQANYGAYVAPFDGIHGWFWQNRGTSAITIELQTSSFAELAIDYRGGFPFEKTLPAQSRPPQ
ncbi:MAG: hypothetical protein AB8B93_03600 [Pseudomonadales bacterium]